MAYAVILDVGQLVLAEEAENLAATERGELYDKNIEDFRQVGLELDPLIDRLRANVAVFRDRRVGRDLVGARAVSQHRHEEVARIRAASWLADNHFFVTEELHRNHPKARDLADDLQIDQANADTDTNARHFVHHQLTALRSYPELPKGSVRFPDRHLENGDDILAELHGRRDDAYGLRSDRIRMTQAVHASEELLAADIASLMRAVKRLNERGIFPAGFDMARLRGALAGRPVADEDDAPASSDAVPGLPPPIDALPGLPPPAPLPTNPKPTGG